MEKKEMTFQEFLDAVRALNVTWVLRPDGEYIWLETVDGQLCPIIAVAIHRLKRQFTNLDWRQAAYEMGLPHEVMKGIGYVSYRIPQSDPKYFEMRRQLLEATGLA